MLSAVCALAMSVSAAVPVFAGTGPSAGAADGGVVKGIYEDFESCTVGDVVSAKLPSGANPYQNSYVTNEIVNDNGNKVLKITKIDNSAEGEKDKDSRVIQYAGVQMNDNFQVHSDSDYWVLKFDLKNGDDANNRYPAIMMFTQIRINENSIWDTKDTSYKCSINSYDWNEFMFIGHSGKVRMIVNGKDCGETAVGRADTAEHFFGGAFADSDYKDFTRVMYVDDIESYSVKNVNRVSTVSLTADAEKGKVYADFDYPVTGFTAENVTVDNGATVSGVDLVNGKYEIALSGVSYGSTYNVTVSGVTDVFGTAVTSASTSFVGSGAINDGVVAKYTEDFENETLGALTNAKLSSGAQAYTGTGITNEIVSDRGGKVIKITRAANTTKNTYAGIKLDKNTEMPDSANFWVQKYDIKNGDTVDNRYPNISLLNQFRVDGTWVGFMVTANGQLQPQEKLSINAYDWNEYMFIGNKSKQTIALVLNGKYVGEYSAGRMQSASSFYGIQVFNAEEKTHDSVMYVDNMEVYGVVSAGRQNVAKLVADNDNAKLYATFTSPVKEVKASDISVTGAEVDSVTYDSKNDRWEIALSGYKSNTDYNVTLNGVEDVFGTTTMSATAKITTPRVQMKKTYLTTTNFKGTEDFEGYDKTGVFVGDGKVDIKRKSDNVEINQIWSGAYNTFPNDKFAISLADDGTGNHAYKLSALSGVADGTGTGAILQVKPDTDWTEKAQGKYFVYEMKFKSGDEAKGEAPFSSQHFTTSNEYTAQLCFEDGSVVLTGNVKGTVENAFKVKEWNTLQYVIDYSREVPKSYLLINGKAIASYSMSGIVAKNSKPRFAQAYVGKGANASIYYDDFAIYTIEPMKITDVTVGTDNVKVNVVTGYENSASDTVAADLWVAVYNTETGALVSVAKAADKILYGDNEYTANVTVGAGQTVKAFIWGGVNALTPLCSYASK